MVLTASFTSRLNMSGPLGVPPNRPLQPTRSERASGGCGSLEGAARG